MTFHDDAEFAEFSKFYKASVPELMAFLRYVGASYENAEECIQDTLEKALPPMWSTLTSPLAWCRVTCYRSYLCRVRRNREQLVAEFDAVDHSLIAHDVDFEALDELHEITGLIRQMPLGHRRDVLAYRLAGAGYGEIAEVLGITESNARSTYRYAKEQLKRLREGGGTPT